MSKMPMIKKESYASPQMEVMRIENEKVLCVSTEGFGTGDNGLNDGDWS